MPCQPVCIPTVCIYMYEMNEPSNQYKESIFLHRVCNIFIVSVNASMVIHDTECPYWDLVSLNNPTQIYMEVQQRSSLQDTANASHNVSLCLWGLVSWWGGLNCVKLNFLWYTTIARLDVSLLKYFVKRVLGEGVKKAVVQSCIPALFMSCSVSNLHFIAKELYDYEAILGFQKLKSLWHPTAWLYKTGLSLDIIRYLDRCSFALGYSLINITDPLPFLLASWSVLL